MLRGLPNLEPKVKMHIIYLAAGLDLKGEKSIKSKKFYCILTIFGSK